QQKAVRLWRPVERPGGCSGRRSNLGFKHPRLDIPLIVVNLTFEETVSDLDDPSGTFGVDDERSTTCDDTNSISVFENA
ncbi:hypothetical protein ACEQ6C_39880, partial [Rhizobium ruizarguesonis]